jgi:hypothetical protein
VDVLDVHYYPAAVGVVSDDETEPTASLRLRSLKSLYDPTYVDESWIGDTVELVPRLAQLVQANCPGMNVSVSEYSWGGDTGITSALAQAEALAIFGREGVDIATRAAAPAAGTKVEEAFRLFLDFDGAGAAIKGDSVSAQSSDVDAVGSYAILGTDRIYVLLFNKLTSEVVADVDVADATVGASAAVFGFDAVTTLASAGTLVVSGSAVHPTLPARSATLIVVPLSLPPCGGA